MALEMGATDQGTTMSQMSDWLGTHGFNVDSGIRADSNQPKHIPRCSNP
jgi:hypothetical protein